MGERILGCCLVVALLGLGGCATGPSYSEVKSTIPPLTGDHGRIYFYRVSGIAGAAVQPDIRLNEEVVGSSQPNSFFYVDRLPGRMEVRVATETENRIAFGLAAGQTRYVETRVEMGILVGHVIPKLVTPEQGEMDLESGTLAYVPSEGAQSSTVAATFPGAPTPGPADNSPVNAPVNAPVKVAAVQSAQEVASGTAKPGNLPPAGSQWSYAVRQRGAFSSDNRDYDFSVVLANASGSTVMELFRAPSGQEPSAEDARALSFILHRGAGVMELSPYLLAYTPSPQLPLRQALPAYPEGAAGEWTLRAVEIAPESLSTPAGRFNALRLRIVGQRRSNQAEVRGPTWQAANRYTPDRFQYTVWYAPEAGRYVQSRRQLYNFEGRQFSEQWVQLKSFHIGAAATQ